MTLFIRAVATLAICLGLTACWKQHDIIAIASDGTTAFESEVEITEKGFPFEAVDEISDDFIRSLVKTGWQVKKEWISKEEPFRLRVSGSGNLTTVGNASNLYEIRKEGPNKYQIHFIPAEAKGGKSSRSITFKKQLLKSDATVLDPNGREVSEIANVLGSTTYTIVLSTAAPSGRLDDEALSKGKDYITPVFLQCGKSWFGVEALQGQVTAVLEFNQPTISISAAPITQADTLNGVDWKGTLHFRAPAYREYDFNQRTWTKWQDSQGRDLYIVEIERRGGKWLFSGAASKRGIVSGPGWLVRHPKSYTCEIMSSPPRNPKE